MNTTLFKKPISAQFVPKPDITAYELAILLPYFHGKAMYEEEWGNLGEMQRHFVRQP